MNWASLIVAACAVGVSGVATAQELVKLGAPTEGYTYFNQPGADISAHDADVRSCSTSASLVLSVDAAIGNDRGLIAGLMAIGPGRAAFVSAVENCMVVRGWRVVRLGEQEGVALSERPAAEISAQLASWVGADAPEGQIVRTWNNDASNAATDRYELRASRTAGGALSIQSLGDVRIEAASRGHIERTQIDRNWPRNHVRPADFAEAPEGSAIVIFQIRGLSFSNGIGISLMRLGNDEMTLPSTIDHGPDLMSVLVPLISNRREGNWRAFVVPAGRWRIASMGAMPVLNFCLGSPSFEARPGEVIFAGAFDLGADSLTPDLSLDAARAWVGAGPFAERMRAADYSNGWSGLCGDNAIYALEFDGLPFREGYRWGGAYERAIETEETATTPVSVTEDDASAPEDNLATTPQ